MISGKWLLWSLVEFPSNEGVRHIHSQTFLREHAPSPQDVHPVGKETTLMTHLQTFMYVHPT